VNWIVAWVAFPSLSMLVGATLGWSLGRWVGFAWQGAAGGALAACVASAGVQAWRAIRFLRWLADPARGRGLPQRGLWAELAYRLERRFDLHAKALNAEQARLAGFLKATEASPNGLMIIDAHEQIQWFNSVAADHFGLVPQRDLQQHVTNLLRAPSFVQHMQEGRFEGEVLMPGARARSSLAVWVRPYGEGMKLLLSQDITERERNEAMRRDFVANVSHEIRTPLTVLAGFIETLGSLPLTEVERKRVVELMTQQTERMQLLVADLLTLAQLEGSPRPGIETWVDMDKLFQRVAADGQALSGGRHPFQLRGPRDCGMHGELAGAEGELLSAMGNLVSNAVRYTPSGGQISLVWRDRADGGAEFEVQDTGVGVAREHLPRLTERFYRVDGSRSRETGGTGLGLSIVKHVVARHGGELDIQSELGKGSSFRIVFPPARVRLARAATTQGL
jgi:two-component system phosphate regulon sensor histidine kinase PhoR